MEYDLTEQGGALIVALKGEIDLQTSPQARQVLLEAVGKGQLVLVDLAGVSYIDSSGVASMVEALQAARKVGNNLALVSVSEGALRVLKLARLDKVFSIHDTVDTALAG